MPPTAENLQSIEKYTRRAAGYDATTGRTWPIRERCIALMGLRSGETALDVGCGTGLSFELLARAVDTSGRVLAFEQSAAMHEHAAARAQALRSLGYRIDLQLASAEDVRLPASPDAVLMHYVHDITRTPSALCNLLAQWLPGTRVVIAGMKFFPWWLAPLNLLAWLKNRPYNVRAAELHRPWSLIEPYLEDFRVESTQLGMGYIGHARVASISDIR